MGGRYTVWPVTGDGTVMNVDEGRDGAGTCTCGGKDETTHGGKEGKKRMNVIVL